MLQHTAVSLKLRKYPFVSDKIKYFRQIIKLGRLEIDCKRVSSPQYARHPTNLTDIRSFLGLGNLYRLFIKDFCLISAPLNKLLRKGIPTKLESFGAIEEVAFRTLIYEILSPKVFTLPKEGLPYSVGTNASQHQIGIALFQTYPSGEWKPIRFLSRSLKGAETRYPVTGKECLAVVWALTTFRHYLQRDKFTINTNHS